MWRDAYEALSRAEAFETLTGEDLERLATAAYLVGHEDEYVRILERAHHRYVETGRPIAGARCALWAGLILGLRGKLGPANGWFGM